MDIEEFTTFITKLPGVNLRYGNGFNAYPAKPPRAVKPPKVNTPFTPDEIYLAERWVTGGTTGGSCYGSEHMHGRNADPEPALCSLDSCLK